MFSEISLFGSDNAEPVQYILSFSMQRERLCDGWRTGGKEDNRGDGDNDAERKKIRFAHLGDGVRK